jgi:flagellar basal-body rod protein FlgB
MLENIGLMKGIGGKMAWLNQRQTVISTNIANADTPNYRPSDLTDVDFGDVMRAAKNKPMIGQVKTNSQHITGRGVQDPENRESRNVYETAPAENSVVLEEQLIKSQATQADYNLMTNLYRKNIGMIKSVVATR